MIRAIKKPVCVHKVALNKIPKLLAFGLQLCRSILTWTESKFLIATILPSFGLVCLWLACLKQVLSTLWNLRKLISNNTFFTWEGDIWSEMFCYPIEKPVRPQGDLAYPKLTLPLPSQPESYLSSHVYKVYFNWDPIIYSLLFHIGDISNDLLFITIPHLVWYCTSHKSHKLFGLLEKSYRWSFLQIYPLWN